METFKSKSVFELQQYLKSRGVTFSNIKKAGLIDLCKHAESLHIEIDPDGMVEDREIVLQEKLITTDGNILRSPQFIEGSYDISLASSLSIFDIYNYLVSFDEFDHASLRHYDKLEGYTMQQDGYVLDLKAVNYSNGHIGLKSYVKPRTNDKDPVNKLPHYLTWIVLKNSEESTDCTCIMSANCTCKGGMVGCCRHVIATLFEVIDFCQDSNRKNCTSGPCQWVRRSSEASKLSKPMPATDLNTSIIQTRPVVPRPCNFQTLPDTFDLPNPDAFLQGVKTLYPKACILDTKYVRKTYSNPTPILNVETPMQKLSSFLSSHKCITDTCLCSNIFQYYHLCYSESEQNHVEFVTMGQSQNSNWFNMRKDSLQHLTSKKYVHPQT